MPKEIVKVLEIELDEETLRDLIRIANERKRTIRSLASEWITNTVGWVKALEEGGDG